MRLDNAISKALETPPEPLPANSLPHRTFDETLALIVPRLHELGFDDREPHNFNILSRYLAHLVGNKYYHKAKRGIWLGGPVGSGKTVALEIVKRQLEKIQAKRNKRAPLMVSAITFATGVSQHGLGCMLDKYAAMDGGRQVDLVIDDIGTERESVHFGARSWSVSDLLHARYVIWCKTGARTHITTNLPIPDLQRRYDERIISRMREMCVHASFTGSDRRRDQQTAQSGR